MAMTDRMLANSFLLFILVLVCSKCSANDILGCGGFVKSHANLDFSKIEIGLYTKEGSLKERTECAPTNGYYFLPLYEKGQYVLKVHPPAGWSFEPSQVDLQVDGVTDPCSSGQDINFSFNGFGITGRVITAGQKLGPQGVAVQLIDEKGGKRDTVTTVGGDFHFTPVIPGKYTLKASHPRWKLEPSQAVVQVKEGNTVLPVGVLSVKGYDVKGSVTAYGSPISGVYVLLYSKEENPKFRVEGCQTALLQGVPDAPICHSVTDNNGEFNFGLVPAGEYKLLALSKSPGQAAVSFNLKTTSVPFSVAHDGLYIKNAFEVTGFTVVGSVLTNPGGSGIPGVRVELDGAAVGKTDAAGKFTLPELQPRSYTLRFKHEQCEFEDLPLQVSNSGLQRGPTVSAARWRVCGAVRPARGRALAVQADKGGFSTSVQVEQTDEGKWCTFLPPGSYSAKVEVTEHEYKNGLRYYPLSQPIIVGRAPVDDISFSQLKAVVSGRVECDTVCRDLQVTLRNLGPDGGPVGEARTTTVKNGEYSFSDVTPGVVSVSVPNSLCWAAGEARVSVSQARASVPTFTHTGHALVIRSHHDLEVDYKSSSSKGSLAVPAGESRHCLAKAELYTLTPRGCHKFRPDTYTVDLTKGTAPPVDIIAVSHAATIRVTSPESANDLVLKVNLSGRGTTTIGPLVAKAKDGQYEYEHTLYLAEGEISVVSASSASLLFSPSAPHQLVGAGACNPHALTIRARAALTVRGRTQPPVEGVMITLTADDLTLTQETSSDGTYSFGPLDAAASYSVTAEKESYVFGERQPDGTIPAHRLADIAVKLEDSEDGAPLQGALVSVSGGAYRRNAASGPDGALRFGALSPAQYYVKPHMKEYRFDPPHHILDVKEGNTHHLTLKGTRVAWSCVGALVSLGGAGWRGAGVRAKPTTPGCATEEANTEDNGAFRIRGLLPGCVYHLELKESTAPELSGLKLALPPPEIQIKDNRDISDIRLIGIQPHQLTDASVLVRTPNPDHYRSLRLTLSLETSAHTPLFSTKLDPTGFSQNINPGLMYVMPRLPADNKTYVIQLESSLSKATHVYGEEVFYFNSDGKFKHFTIDFLPKVKSAEQELRQTSLLVLPLLGLVLLAYLQRDLVLDQASKLLAGAVKLQTRPPRQEKPKTDLLDKASIDHILNTVNNAGKKVSKKKQ